MLQKHLETIVHLGSLLPFQQTWPLFIGLLFIDPSHRTWRRWKAQTAYLHSINCAPVPVKGLAKNERCCSLQACTLHNHPLKKKMMRIFNHGDNSWLSDDPPVNWFLFMLPEIFGCQIGWVLHFGPFATPGWGTLCAEAVQSLPHSALRSPSATDSTKTELLAQNTIFHVLSGDGQQAAAVSPKNESCCRMRRRIREIDRLFQHHELEIAMWRDPSTELCLDWKMYVNLHDLPDWNYLRLFLRIFEATQTLYRQTMAATKGFLFISGLGNCLGPTLQVCCNVCWK